ncbi:MAG: thiopurine S-methyltransferase [Hyphomicrobiaceae bacterium]|nr:thiopurine S-methyltransferase [Hyphomicrobiaceae bacterium]
MEDPNFWLERWQKNEIGFHSPDVQPALSKNWPALGIAKGERVFVPLCGKSLDMVWLSSAGYDVVGAELSALAIDAFFSEQGLTPQSRTQPPFEVKSAERYELWCGDFFALKKSDVNATAAYDRAALVAMPPDMQAAYATKMGELLPAGAKVLLIGLDYDPKEMQGPPFNVPQDRVREMFGENFEISVIDARDGLTKSEHLKKRGITWLEEASYLLVRRS